jgi:2-polyprenyl-3-methyl-5-hydroxy-6-metoxy-1,4-benzoquinol methylase
MKSARDVAPASDEEARLRDFDLREIDSEDPRSHFALKYRARLDCVLATIRRHVPAGGEVLEVGCAQANASLLLAEAGYHTVALDLMPGALSYGRRKHERGDLRVLCGSVDALPLRDGAFDAVLVGELLEHCARPAHVLGCVARVLRPRGALVITTPNGEWIGAVDRTYSAAGSGSMAARQYGRGGEDHLYTFTLRELVSVVREAGLVVERTMRCSSVLHSDRLSALKRLASPSAILRLGSLACAVPGLGRATALTLVVVARKECC